MILTVATDSDIDSQKALIKRYHEEVRKVSVRCPCTVNLIQYKQDIDKAIKAPAGVLENIVKTINDTSIKSKKGLTEASLKKIDDLAASAEAAKVNILDASMAVPRIFLPKARENCRACNGKGSINLKGVYSFDPFYDERWFKDGEILSLKRYESLIRISTKSAKLPHAYISDSECLTLFFMVLNDYAEFFYKTMQEWKTSLSLAISRDLESKPNAHVFAFSITPNTSMI